MQYKDGTFPPVCNHVGKKASKPNHMAIEKDEERNIVWDSGDSHYMRLVSRSE
jgi:hypothetical protein